MIVLHKLLVSPKRYAEVARIVFHQTYWPELALIAAMCRSVQIARWSFRMRPKNRDVEDEAAVESAFQASKSRRIALVLRQLGLLQAALYFSDVFLVILKHLDFKFVVKYRAQQVVGSVLLSSWMAYNLSRLKYQYLKAGPLSLKSLRARRDASKDGPPIGEQNRLLNQVLDVIIYSCAFLTVVDLLGIQMGFALKSIFGLGSFGTLALSLASKDLAAEFVGGLMIHTSNFFDEGETVVLQDGTRGSVVKMGWLVSAKQRLVSIGNFSGDGDVLNAQRLPS